MTIRMTARAMTIDDGTDCVPFNDKQRTLISGLIKQALGFPTE